MNDGYAACRREKRPRAVAGMRKTAVMLGPAATTAVTAVCWRRCSARAVRHCSAMKAAQAASNTATAVIIATTVIRLWNEMPGRICARSGV